ncbi:hypothetical protein Scep_015299 [Stephania cephalantha]|uniref:Retrotransposon Copia-like N-terminal domain-containing protein n=1 Tax=Stephania cephalantha TaxID=152367 RepID=A0AAP0J4V3_9MAGN
MYLHQWKLQRGLANPFGNSLSQGMSIKLDTENFLLWKALIVSFVKGQRFDGYLFGTKPCPTQFLPSEDVNPQYEDWISKDNMFQCWLINSITQPVAISIAGSITFSHSA